MVFEIMGTPVEKKRHRSFLKMNGKIGQYSPQKKEKERVVNDLLIQSPPGFEPTTSPCSVSLFFYMPRPKSHHGTGRNEGVVKPSAPVMYSAKPDIDNMAKFYLDCMEGIVYKNDSQVIGLQAHKAYSSRPCVQIDIVVFESINDGLIV